MLSCILAMAGLASVGQAHALVDTRSSSDMTLRISRDSSAGFSVTFKENRDLY